eukprot:TRINITY_DN19650_c0_g3_i2.p1 TRINITY_DN19650_c0_g3~~TRINITY_DN19650_c0_g3_i2.p1  ORF type:complete len:345 (-),score=88.15 TRINITY_DN19650_c0_g3_i2:169-1203(-)
MCIRDRLPPACLEEMLPIPPEAALTVQIGRAGTVKVLERTDDRLIVICGPCSIHDTKAGLEYATKLRAECLKHAADLLIIMRVYFEKPRTTVGWKGLINDPNMDGTFNINQGLQTARQFLIDVNKLGIPCATEFLDTVSPQYCADLISWGAIGARTTESQLHRELASGLSVPIGFKNGTSGALQIAVDAVKSANNPHAFMGVTRQGLAAIIETAGNPHGHVILRGGSETGPQFSAEWVSKTAAAMSKAGVHPNVVVDCSHANSQKKHENQPKVAADVASQLKGGSKDLVGLMLESHLHEGNQAIKGSPADLKYGVSVTDACIDFETTEKVLDELAEAVRIRREN